MIAIHIRRKPYLLFSFGISSTFVFVCGFIFIRKLQFRTFGNGKKFKWQTNRFARPKTNGKSERILKTLFHWVEENMEVSISGQTQTQAQALTPHTMGILLHLSTKSWSTLDNGNILFHIFSFL